VSKEQGCSISDSLHETRWAGGVIIRSPGRRQEELQMEGGGLWKTVMLVFVYQEGGGGGRSVGEPTKESQGRRKPKRGN
jgi:hypothetical protein